MPDISPNTNDGRCSVSKTSWVSAKNTTSQFFNSTNRFLVDAIKSARNPARGGGYRFSISRSFFYFDTSGISVAPAAAQLNLKGYHADTTNADFFAIKSTHSTTLSAGDFDAFPLSSSPGANDGSGGGDMESLVTKYSSEITTFNAGSFNLITLNSTALADMASLATFKFCLMESVHDMRDIEPSAQNANSCYYMDATSSGDRPYITYIEGTSAPSDSATFFGTNF